MTMLGLLLACADTRLLLVLRYGWMLEQDHAVLACWLVGGVALPGAVCHGALPLGVLAGGV